MREIQLTKGKVAFIDDEDYELVSRFKWIANKGFTQSTWYVVMSGNPWCTLHRFIMKPTNGLIVDHANGNGLDNRRCNLRITTNSGNQHNRDSKGYYWEKARGKWYCSIMVDGKKTLLGRFDKEEDAAETYRKAKERVLLEIFGAATQEDIDYGE